MNRLFALTAAMVMSWITPSFAQGSRDPTLPPEAAGLGSSTSPGQRAAGIDGGAFTIIVRNGVPSLVVGTRLYTQGQKMGNATIERIAETEVWLREGRVLRKVSQFPGIERRTLSASPANAVASAKPSAGPRPKKPASRCDKTAAPNVSCASDKP